MIVEMDDGDVVSFRRNPLRFGSGARVNGVPEQHLLQHQGWSFETTCVGSDCESITNMQAQAKPLTYWTLRKHLGPLLTVLERDLGYDTGHERGGLRMRKDWAVSYARSTYRGLPCLYVVWSHIEHIFVYRRP